MPTTDLIRLKLFKEIDQFLEKADATKSLSRETRITKLSKPLTIIALNFIKKEK